MIRNLILKRFFATTKNLYSILGIAENSSASEIKKAYIEVSKRINWNWINWLKLAKKYHPDKSTEKNAKEKFVEIQEAYEVLKIFNLTWLDLIL